MIMITPAEFEDEMRRISNSQNEEGMEMTHVAADELMCKVLKDNGYEAGVKIFEKMRKWYA